MFIRSKKLSSDWGFIGGGAFFCALALSLLSGLLGPVPEAGRGALIAAVGLPIGGILIIIGIVKLLRSTAANRSGDDDPGESMT